MRLWSSPALHVTHAPRPDGTGDVSVTVRVDALDDMDRESVEDVVAGLLADSAPEVRAAATGSVAGAATRVWRHHAPLDSWVRHRMTVVGCAAQPILPHVAQSTSLALLDAAALGRAFDQADGRIAPALQEYSRTRADSHTDAAERARDFSTLCHADGLLRRMRDRLWRASPVDATAAVVEAADGGPVPPVAGGRVRPADPARGAPHGGAGARGQGPIAG